MARHLLKVIFLLIPAVCTVCLLAFCLISDWWVAVNPSQLDTVRARFEANYMVYTGEKPASAGRDDRDEQLLKAVAAVGTTNASRVRGRTSTTTTTTTTAFDEFDSESGVDEDSSEADEPYDTPADGTASSSSLGAASYSDYDSTPEADEPPRHKRAASGRVVDYVYIAKLWPLVKFKSLYSECIEYKKFYLKISTAYLSQPNKEPIVGTINYGKYLTELAKSAPSKQCDTKLGMIKCTLTQQCVYGKICDGIVDCDDQSDEQVCDASANVKCHAQSGGVPLQCDNRCWHYWNRCDQIPHCLDMSDELDPSCQLSSSVPTAASLTAGNSTPLVQPQHQHTPFTLGQFHYDKKHNCFVSFFDFKSAQLIRKENLKYLTQSLADHIQETNNINYHLQLIYSLAFASGLVFSMLALISLLFVMCFKKLCFQCPFWFYGFFAILSWLACSFGLMTFLYQAFSNKQKTLDPFSRLPLDNELMRLNPELASVQQLGIAFWVAVAATSTSFLASFVSCIVCCRLPSARHEDKEYKIMQLPTYT